MASSLHKTRPCGGCVGWSGPDDQDQRAAGHSKDVEQHDLPACAKRNCETAAAVWRDRCQDRHWYRGMTPNATDALMGCLGTELSAVVPAPAWRSAMLA